MEQCPGCGNWTLGWSAYHGRTQCDACGYIQPIELENLVITKEGKFLAREIKKLKEEIKKLKKRK